MLSHQEGIGGCWEGRYAKLGVNYFGLTDTRKAGEGGSCYEFN